jgi:hypothetical protein
MIVDREEPVWMCGTDYLLSYLTGRNESDRQRMMVISAKHLLKNPLSRGKGVYYSLDRPPLMDVVTRQIS